MYPGGVVPSGTVLFRRLLAGKVPCTSKDCHCDTLALVRNIPATFWVWDYPNNAIFRLASLMFAGTLQHVATRHLISYPQIPVCDLLYTLDFRIFDCNEFARLDFIGIQKIFKISEVAGIKPSEQLCVRIPSSSKSFCN